MKEICYIGSLPVLPDILYSRSSLQDYRKLIPLQDVVLKFVQIQSIRWNRFILKYISWRIFAIMPNNYSIYPTIRNFVFHQASARDNKIDRFPNMMHIFGCTAQFFIYKNTLCSRVRVVVRILCNMSWYDVFRRAVMLALVNNHRTASKVSSILFLYYIDVND